MNKLTKECSFCEQLAEMKLIDEMQSKRDKAEGQEPFLIEYTVAIVRRMRLKSRGKRGAGRTVNYKNAGNGFELNCCPECGKRLK